MKDRQMKLEAFGRILDILDELRVKCPWDRAQTTESLRPQTIEETYELSDAILKKDDANISKELGDVLLHVLFYAKIGEENGTYDIVDVINHLCDKLIYRHPHVFSSVQVADAAEVVKNWEQLKLKEKDGNKRVLSGVPETLPPLLKAYRMQDKARGSRLRLGEEGAGMGQGGRGTRGIPGRTRCHGVRRQCGREEGSLGKG